MEMTRIISYILAIFALICFGSMFFGYEHCFYTGAMFTILHIMTLPNQGDEEEE